MSTPKNTKSVVSKTNAVTAKKAKALVAEVKTVLAAGEPLTVKQRKEVLVRSIRTTSAMVDAAASAYTESPEVLGGDLDPTAALSAQDFVTEMTPVANELAALLSALADRIGEHKATAAGFTQTVHDRLKGLQSMPQGPALASRLAQIEKLRPKRKKPAAAVVAAPTAAGVAAPATKKGKTVAKGAPIVGATAAPRSPRPPRRRLARRSWSTRRTREAPSPPHPPARSPRAGGAVSRYPPPNANVIHASTATPPSAARTRAPLRRASPHPPRTSASPRR